MWNVRLRPPGLRRDGKNYRLQDIQLEASSSQLPVSSHQVAASGRIFHWRLGTGNWQLFFDIVWDDPPTLLRGCGATNPAVFADSSRAESAVSREGGTPGSTNKNC